MASSQIDELLRLKDKIEKTRARYAEISGELKAQYKRLQTDYNLASIDDAKTKVIKIEKEITTLDEKLASLLAGIQEALNDND